MKKNPLVNLPQMDNYSSRQEWEIACWENIIKSHELLKLMITHHERHTVVMRAAATEGLLAGRSYKQISEWLWLSPQTISVLKKALKEKGYQSYCERSKTERKKRKYSQTINPMKRRRGRPHRTKYGIVYLP